MIFHNPSSPPLILRGGKKAYMKVVYSPKCLEYYFPGHPESPERVKLIYEELKKDKRFEFIKPIPVTETDILTVHTKELLELVKLNTFFDPDTPNISSIYESALLSVEAAIKASEIAIKEGSAFSLSRPPGHHATKTRVGGFCYFNNIAVATAKLLKSGKRVAILDIDVHHGNGTQDIFLGNKDVLYCSLHQIPLYPGTGWQSENNCFNFPLSPGTTFAKYKKELEKALLEIQLFKPDIIGVSLGFDAYKEDPLANISLEIKDYIEVGKLIRQLNLRTFFVLEGGYSADIGNCAASFFKGFLD